MRKYRFWFHWFSLVIWLAVSTAEAAPWKWICYGDTRTNDAFHRAVLQAMATHTPDYRFIINVGDVTEDGTNAALWDTWKAAVDGVLGAQVLDPALGQNQFPPQYMSTSGNHDQVPGAGQTNWNLYLPGQNAQFGNGGRYFWFDYQNARFVILNSEEDINGPQKTMLLNAIQTNPQDWLFVIWHRPIFDFGAKVYEGGIHTTWGVPLHNNGCDIIFMGHAHYYVRTKELNLNGVMNPPLEPGTGTVQVVTGNGAAPFYAVDENHDGNGYMVDYSFDVSQAAYHGYTELTVDGRTLTLKHYAADGPLKDSVTDTAVYTANPKPGWALSPSMTPTVSGTSTPTPTPTPGGPTFQPSAPFHATFFYIWYKNPNVSGESWSYWSDLGNSPPATWFSHYLPDPNPLAFDPANELYSANNYSIFKWQVSKLAEARQEVAIASWWGPGTKEDTALNNILNDFMGRSDNPYPNLRWAVYYEDEGFADPDVPTLTADLIHIQQQFTGSPYFLKVNGKPVIFVYAGATDIPGTMTQRWKDANAAVGNAFYIVLKVFPGYKTDPNQPDSWHQYAPAVRSDSQAPYAYMVSPGFWLDDGSAVRLSRDTAAFESAVQAMAAAGVTWKLTETWNEWGEGTAVEPGVQTKINAGTEVIDPAGTPFGNLYVDILKNNLPALEQGTGADLTGPPNPPRNLRKP